MNETGIQNTVENVPAHIGIIMDGNGRWAVQKKLPRTMGHKEGVAVARRIILAASQCGVKYVTLYTFSTENWKRAQDEVGFLFNLLIEHLHTELDMYTKNSIRVCHAGDFDGLPKSVQKELIAVERDTSSFTGLTVTLAVNYGGRDEIMRSARRASSYVLETSSGLSDLTHSFSEAFNEKNFQRFCDVPDLPDMDLLIRTGGEKRLSNFMLWQSAYAELIFSDVLWPDYTEQYFFNDIADFQKRNRRFGGV